MTQQDLENLFSPYGRIITSRILCDNITGKLTSVRIFLLAVMRLAHHAIVHFKTKGTVYICLCIFVTLP
jgi:ELAV like protein 2/3/4